MDVGDGMWKKEGKDDRCLIKWLYFWCHQLPGIARAGRSVWKASGPWDVFSIKNRDD